MLGTQWSEASQLSAKNVSFFSHKTWHMNPADTIDPHKELPGLFQGVSHFTWELNPKLIPETLTNTTLIGLSTDVSTLSGQK